VKHIQQLSGLHSASHVHTTLVDDFKFCVHELLRDRVVFEYFS